MAWQLGSLAALMSWIIHIVTFASSQSFKSAYVQDNEYFLPMPSLDEKELTFQVKTQDGHVKASGKFIASSDDATRDDILRQAADLLRKPSWNRIYPY